MLRRRSADRDERRGKVARVDAAAVAEGLAGSGDAGARAELLRERADALVPTYRSLSSLTTRLALDYVDRIVRPLPTLSPEQGVTLVTSGYAAHEAVEADPAAFGATDIPVLGTLPPLRRGRPPQDLLLRIVKVIRRQFVPICAVDPEVWDGFAGLATAHLHLLVADDEDLQSPATIGELLRFGWVLRQVDLHYGLAPDRR